jgi:DNA-binding transcriptional LysR family regulator
VTALNHPLAGEDVVSFEETLEFDHVGLHEASAIHAFVKQAANALNKPLKIRIQASNFEAVCRMVEANAGVGVLPESSARRHAQTMAIRIVHLSDEWALRKLHVCVRSMRLLPHFARELVELLVADSAKGAAG